MQRVLVVDDEEPVRLLVRLNLEPLGITVLEAADGLTALELARSGRPDAILLDVMLPGLSGWQVAQELLGDPATSDIPVVFMSARAEVSEQVKGIEIGALDYLTKPFNPVELGAFLRELVDRAQAGPRERIREEKLALLRPFLETRREDAGTSDA